MELCCATARVLSGLPHHHSISNLNSSLPLPPSLSPFPSKQTPISHSNPGLRISGFSFPRASSFEDTSNSTTSGYAVLVRDKEAIGAIKEDSTYDTVSAKLEESPNEADGSNSAEETPGGVQAEVTDFLNKFNLELDSGDTYPILIYGTSALLALWISSTIVGALDSLPLFPKLMEVVGLGYTVWFSYRYLIFKRNRDELLAKIGELKDQIIGRADE